MFAYLVAFSDTLNSRARKIIYNKTTIEIALVHEHCRCSSRQSLSVIHALD